jgi:hypothetical protein
MKSARSETFCQRLRTILRVARGMDADRSALRDDLDRHGKRRLTAEEFEEHFGHLPADGEG